MVMKIKCHLTAMCLKVEIKMDIGLLTVTYPGATATCTGMLEITGQGLMTE